MALINCPECKKEVSDVAINCPHCGAKLRELKRTLFGKIIKWSFIAFNILMLVWMIGGLGSASEGYNTLSEAEKVGAQIGTGIGMMMISGIWLVGDVILGLLVIFTKPKS